ncbi:uncharacterized protein LOC122289257 [Carya illinoinensis]|uniref:uncharacterized protein LOC122289257 n=1 Tax=Carya illinoinensis TaxID=32201 RepID=UPI001C728BFC|nr:uncharacterized protein LOC122289257 [Carya illinoinensis]
MKTLSWNCRGLGNPRTVQDLCHMVEDKKPSVVFLMETKLRKTKAESLRRRLKFEGCMVVEAVGLKGGLIMMWDHMIEVEVENFSVWHISVWIKEPECAERWLLTGFYGQPDSSLREATWSLLSSLKPQSDRGWCVLGDFNEILAHDEKFGGKQRPERQMVRFREVLEEGGLFDLGWRGDKFTWSNKHEDETFTKERLDRAVANSKWMDNHTEGWVEMLVARCSDHRPILLNKSLRVGLGGRYKKLFRFETSWALDGNCEEIVKTVWKEVNRDGIPTMEILHKLAKIEGALSQWSKLMVTDQKKILAEKTAQLRRLQEQKDSHNTAAIKDLQKELGVMLAKEDLK